MTQIIRKTNKLKFHTDLKELIKPFKTEFSTFRWMLTNQDYMVLDHQTKGVVDQLDFGVDYLVFEGNELLEIIENREVQFIWGVFCAFENDIPKLDKKQYLLLTAILKFGLLQMTSFLQNLELKLFASMGLLR